MEEEIWRPVEGFEGLYEVSNLGRVRSLDRQVRANGAGSVRLQKGKIRTPNPRPNGYYGVNLCKHGKIHVRLIHRIVAMAFVPGRTEEKNFINHKDRNPANNAASNLEWCSQSYNVTYAGARQRAWATRIANGKRFPTPKAVESMKDGKVVKRYSSIKEAGQDVGRTPNVVYKCCRGIIKTCAGLEWRYVDQNKDAIC